jgi:hypothetical protein
MGPIMRDDFSSRVKDALARRVALRCSNPGCRKATSGPGADPNSAVNIGVAAHIAAASPGGPRYSIRMSAAERGSIENAIWLCQNCAKLIDSDPEVFTSGVLSQWKDGAERLARLYIETGSEVGESPRSVLELISIVEQRATTIVREFTCLKNVALAAFGSTNWNELREGSQHSCDVKRADHPWFSITSCDQLREEIEGLVGTFIEFHKLHIRELRTGNFVAAHESVEQIHSLLYELHRIVTPPNVDGIAKQKHVRYAAHASDAPFIVEALRRYGMYPGVVSAAIGRELLSACKAQYFIVVEGDNEGNAKRAKNFTAPALLVAKVIKNFKFDN